ncbi:MAG: hypothetical protein Q4E01_06555 [Actinomycetaceae bacterium]|nr:hypothetical protein [Actinomycetaceae bacterium]
MLALTTDRGWTTKRGVKEILRPYLASMEEEGDVLGSFEPFQGLKGEAAAKLLEVIPPELLTDRQNFAPIAGDLLRAAVNNENVELVGYAIGPDRLDERVSIEGFVYFGALEYMVCTFHEEKCECEDLWSRLQTELGLESALDFPDEIRRLRPSWRPQDEGWWVWWD